MSFIVGYASTLNKVEFNFEHFFASEPECVHITEHLKAIEYISIYVMTKA